MGFWGKLGDIWKSDWSWKGVTDAWHGITSNIASGGRGLAGGLWNTVGGLVHTDNAQFSKGLQGFLDFGKGALGVGSNLVSLPFEAPLLKQGFGSAAYVQNELIKRPFGASALVAGNWAQNAMKGNDYDPWSLNTWKQAYNETERVSAGQAFLYGMSRIPGATGVSPTNLAVATTDAIPDPSTAEGQRYFHTDRNARLFSGAMDTALNVFADPTLVGGKLAVAGKLRYLSKPMTLAAVARGEDQAYLTSKARDNLFDFYRNQAKNQDHALQTVFNKTPQGGTANGILFDASRIDNPELAHQTFNDALLAMWGDNTANDRLIQDGVPEMARSLMARKKAGRMGALMQNGDFNDPEVRAVADAHRETDMQSILNAAAQYRGIYGQAYGALVGQNVPRLTFTSKWRVGMHQVFNGDPPAYFGDPANPTSMASAFQAARFMLPSSTFTRIIDFNNPNQAHLLRANWESAKALPAERVADLTSQYARASTPESRFRIFNDGENEVFNAVAAKHGFTPDDVQRVLPLVNRLRGGNRASFTNSRRFMPNDVRQVAQQLLDSGDEVGSHRASQMADEIESAAGRGEVPSSVIVNYDIDGNPIIMPENFDPAAHPLMQSQTQDMAAAMDWRVLHQALRWERRGPLGQKAYKVIDSATSLANAANSVFKVGVLLRLGTAWRAGSDEVLRTMSRFGAAPTLMASASGLVNATSRMYAGARTLAERVRQARTLRGVDTHDVVDAGVSDVAPEVDSLAQRTTHFDGSDVQAYPTYEAALADGTLSVPAYADAVKWHAANDPGSLHPDLAQMVQAHNDGLFSPEEFQNHIVEHALAQQGRDLYADPNWQRTFLDEVAARHADRALGEDARPVVVDPFTGTSPEAQDSAAYSLKRTYTVDPTDELGSLDRFLRANTDDLLKPGYVLHGVVSRSGKFRVGVAQAVDRAAEVTPTGGARLKLSELADKLSPGAQGLVVRTDQGLKRIDSAFDGGGGARLRAQVSAAGAGKSWMDRVSDNNYATLQELTKNVWEDVNPTQSGYANSWERAVNNQLGNDAVARQFMQGRTVDDVLQWMFHTKEGRAYHERMGVWQGRAVEQVNTVKKMVDLYLPDVNEHSAAMRRAALDSGATFNDHLVKVLPDIGDRPTIHGSALDMAAGMTWNHRVNKLVAGFFRRFQDKPADFLARFPFVQESYNRHVEQLVRVAQAQATKEGKNFLPVDRVYRLQDIARERALADSQKYLYDATTNHDLTRLGRLVVPFGSAVFDSAQKWGTIFREKPWVPFNLWKAWTAPDRAGFVQDENGNHLRVVNGQDRWYSVNPKTGEETLQPASYQPKQKMVLFQLPSWVQPSAAGAKVTTAINKDTFNTFLSLPTAGPVVTIPASRFAMSHPEFADNRFVKNFVLPLGPQASISDQLLPGTLKTALGAFNAQDGDLASQQALAIYQTEMVQHALGQRPTVPTFQEVRNQANNLRAIRFLYQFMGLTPQFRTPYAPYVDAYRNMKAAEGQRRQADPNYDVDTDFYNQFGDEFSYLTSSVTRNRLGVPATIGGQKAYQRYQDLIDAHPDIASLIVGREGAGAFSQAVYENQLSQAVSPGSSDKMRQRMSLQESAEDAAVRVGWIKYGKLMDAVDANLAERGLVDINQHGAEDLKSARNKFLNNMMWWDQSPNGGRQLNPWYVDYNTRDSSKMIGRINSMEQVVTDPRLSGRDEFQGLAQYLQGRREMQQIMMQNGIHTLNSTKATDYRLMWQRYVTKLKTDNLSFASLHNRWLSGDQYLDAFPQRW